MNMNMFSKQKNKENVNPSYRIINEIIQETSSQIYSPIMLNSCSESSLSSLLSDKQSSQPEVLILDEDNDSDIEIDEISMQNAQTSDDYIQFNKFISKIEIHTELIFAKTNSSVRLCTTGLSYSNLTETNFVLVNHPLSAECVHKRYLYFSKPNLSLLSIPIRTRVYNHTLSLFGFIYEKPCPLKNRSRYLVIYDNYTAFYHCQTDFHICLYQNFEKHLVTIEHNELRSYYQNAFKHVHKSRQFNYDIGKIIRVRKFGSEYHNARIIDKDCSIIKICFFQRKSQTEIWIHSNSSMIESSNDLSLLNMSLSTIKSDNKTSEIITSDSDSARIHKRKTNVNNIFAGRKKIREQSNTKQTQNVQRQSSTSSDETSSLVPRTNSVTTYYSDILLPKFRVLNKLPYVEHKCDRECILLSEEKFDLKTISINPYLLPFECQWSIVEGKPRGYRTPCHRTFYSLDDIEKYLYRTNSKLSIKFFLDDLTTRFAPSIEQTNKQFIITHDISNGIENVPISVYNDNDDEKPNHFTYITEVRPFNNRINAAFRDTNMTSCCDCTDNCSDRMKCACFRKTLDQAILNRDPIVMEKQKYRYTLSYIMKTIGYQKKRLLNPVSSGIYECNSKCSCHPKHCSNRLVQQGIYVQLELFKDKKKGWSLRTLHDLPRGTFISQYIGELITSDQGHERAQTMDDRYQTNLDLVKQIFYKIDNDDSFDDDDEDTEPYVIDGSMFSNIGRYFNHSCDPNMYIQNVLIESHDLHFPNLALFTGTRVKAGEELTWHYNCELLPDREIKCFCGSKNCRGRIL